jgi:hypothetical protein
MANAVNGPFALQYALGSVTWGTGAGGSVIKVALMKSSYVHDKTTQFVAAVRAQEIGGVAGYVGGFGGAGNKVINTKTIVDDAISKIKLGHATVTWAGLGTGDTIGGALYWIPGTSDADSLIVGYADPVDIPTNGSDIMLTPAAGVAFEWTY